MRKNLILLLYITALLLFTLGGCAKQEEKAVGNEGAVVNENETAETSDGQDQITEPSNVEEVNKEITEDVKDVKDVTEETDPTIEVIDVSWPEDFSLYEAYEDYFLIGTIYADSSRTPKNKTLILKHFNSMTPENLMKPEYMQPTEGNFNYQPTTLMLSYGTNNNMAMIGHTLVWHSQSGPWLGKNVSREVAIEQLKSHIQTIVKNFKGEFVAWDVVNEAINDGVQLPKDGDWTKCLRDTQWLRSIGPDYLEMAFQFAREADPDLKLYYNDYNLNNKAKSDIVYAMVKDFIDRGVPIDGIGMQGHYASGVAISSVEYSLRRFSELGVEISITELDVVVNGASATGLTAEEELAQAMTYAKLFRLFKNYKNSIARVTFWGNLDNLSWRKDRYPCLFNSDYTPKQAVYAVLDPDKFLEVHGEQTVKLDTASLEANYGTPVIDGEIDDIWKNSKSGQVNRQVTAWEGATGTVKALWDEKYIYVLTEVKDGVLNHSSSNLYEQDSVEMYLDQRNEKTSYYEEDDGQYRVNYMGTLSLGSIPDVKGFEAKAKVVEGGYIVEARIPLIATAKDGMTMGFDIQINDSNFMGIRNCIAKFSDNTDYSYQNTENWGNLLLVK